MGALQTGSEAVVFSLASLSSEAGRITVSLALRRPPDPALEDVSGDLLEPLNPSMGDVCGGCSTGPSPKMANVSPASVDGEVDRIAVALGFQEPPDPALGDVSSGLPEPPNPAMGEVCWGGCGSSSPSPKGGAKGVRCPGQPPLSGQVKVAGQRFAIWPGLHWQFCELITPSTDGRETGDSDESLAKSDEREEWERDAERGEAEESDEAWREAESRSERKQRVEGEWDGDSPGSDEIFFTLALPPKRFK